MNFKISLFLCSLCLLTNDSVFSQTNPISKTEIQGVVAVVSVKLQKGYVFPKVADRMAEHIQEQLKLGAYDKLASAEEFATQLTEDLRYISNDKHIRVKYRSEKKGALVPDEDGDIITLKKKVSEMPKKKDYGFVKVEILDGNVGLIQLDGFHGIIKKAGPVADLAMAKVSNVDALIFDLRQNGGGSPDMIVHLTSYLLKEKTHINSFYYRSTDKITKSYTNTKVKGKKMDHVPVYILTSNYTFSAAEEFTYNLKHLKRATVIGEITGGGANPGGMIPIGKKFEMFVPGGRAINPITKTNWEGVGVIPHIEVSKEKALERAHAEAIEFLSAKVKK